MKMNLLMKNKIVNKKYAKKQKGDLQYMKSIFLKTPI